MIKRKLSVLLGVLLLAGAFTPQVSTAASLVIEIGDRPYYNHGPRYWSHGRHWCWVPGHWRGRHHHRHWIHGHYVRCY